MLRFIEVESAKLLLSHCWSTYFRGGPFISEVVQILQYYSEVQGPGGPNTSKCMCMCVYLDWGKPFWGGPFLSWQHIEKEQKPSSAGSREPRFEKFISRVFDVPSPNSAGMGLLKDG